MWRFYSLSRHTGGGLERGSSQTTPILHRPLPPSPGIPGQEKCPLTIFKHYSYSLAVVAWVLILGQLASAQVLRPSLSLRQSPNQYTITAGNALFEESPQGPAEFDFGDAGSPFNVLTGFNAAHIYQKPGDYILTLHRPGQPDIKKPVHVVPDNRQIIRLAPGTDFELFLRRLPNNCVVLMPCGQTFTNSRPTEIVARNVCFRAEGQGPPPCIKRVAGFSYSSILVHSSDVTFDGITFDSDKPSDKYHGRVSYRGVTSDGARLVLKQCTFRNIDVCMFCNGSSRGLLVQWCTITPEVRTYGIWLDGSDVVVLGSTFRDSQEEHNIRADEVGFHNLLLYQDDFTNTHGKETFTFRVGENAYISHCAFHNWVRLGPTPRKDLPMTPEELRTRHASHIVFTNNRLDGKAWLNIDEGASDVLIRYNKIDQDAVGVPLRAQGPNLKDIRVIDNIRNLTAGPTAKPFIRQWQTEPGNIVEKGTRDVQAKAPAAQPGK